MKRFQYIATLTLAFIATFFSSCTKENENNEEPELRTITYKIGTRTIDANANNNEMMKSLLLFFVKGSTIEQKVSLNALDNVERTQLEVELQTGLTTVYGFANLTEEQITSLGLDVNNGDAMPDVKAKTLLLANNPDISVSGIPMSNTLEINVSKTAGQSFNMELIRMLCKVGVTFSNMDMPDIKVKQFSITPITGSSIKLLPTWTNNSLSLSLPTGNIDTETFTYRFGDNGIEADGNTEYTFYLNESKVADGDWFSLTITTITGNQTTEDIRISYTNDSYRELKRNDYLKLPISLSDYKLEIEVTSYPPIGGYPSASEKGNEYYCFFPGGGPIIIRPRIIKTSTQEKVEPKAWNIRFTDATQPLFESGKGPKAVVNGEILATMKEGSFAGRALLEISATLNDNTGRSYKIYIQNQANN